MALGFGGLPGPAVAQAPEPSPADPDRFEADPFEPVREHIREVMARRSLASVSVAVGRDGEILWEEAFGWADRERRIRATPHTLYSLASISKPITATALMGLAEEGRLELDAPVNRYLGAGGLTGLAGDASDATVRRVLSHTAGLPLHYQFFYADEPHSPPSRGETVARYGIVAFPPGEVYNYSNFGYGLLDHLVSRLGDGSYESHLRTEVFLPLGMTRSSVGVGPGLEPYAAVRYDGDQKPLPFYSFDHDGASAVWASAHDLVRFGLFHLGHDPEGGRAVLSREAREAMQRAETPDGTSPAYGLGWLVDDEYGFRRVFHTGSMPGVSTMLALYPEQDVAIVVLLNNLDREMRVEIARKIAEVVIPGYAEAREEARGNGGSPRARSAVGELAGTWEGTVRTWEDRTSLTLRIREDGDVHVRIGDQLWSVLNNAGIEDGHLTGRFPGRIPTSDALRAPRQQVYLNLRMRDGTLKGTLTALSEGSPTRFALSSYGELTRTDEGGS